jgi:hypothetical protein
MSKDQQDFDDPTANRKKKKKKARCAKIRKDIEYRQNP